MSPSHRYPLQVIPALAIKIGLNEAIILQQVHYWLNPRVNKNIVDGCHWVYNTYAQWEKHFPFWSQRTIRSVIRNLEEEQLLISFVTKAIRKRKFYTINYERLNTMMQLSEGPIFKHLAKNENSSPTGELCHIDLAESARCNKDTEITLQKLLLPPIAVDQQNISSVSFNKQEDEEEIISKKPEDLCSSAIHIWNKTIQQSLERPAVHRTQKRYARLNRALDGFFQQDLSAWKSYCDQIASCQFLMGESKSGFKVTFDWALVPDNIVKILEVGIYDKASQKKLPNQMQSESWEDYAVKLRKHCSAKKLPDQWISICESLLSFFGQSTFNSWFWEIVPQKLGNSEVVLAAPTLFMKDYISNNYQNKLQQVFQQHFPDLENFKIIFDPTLQQDTDANV